MTLWWHTDPLPGIHRDRSGDTLVMINPDQKHKTLGPFEWLFSSSTFFSFCYYPTRLAVWFFPVVDETRRKNSLSNFCWMTFDFFWRKNVDDENSHTNGSIDAMLLLWWANVAYGCQPWKQHWMNLWCLLVVVWYVLIWSHIHWLGLL